MGAFTGHDFVPPITHFGEQSSLGAGLAPALPADERSNVQSVVQDKLCDSCDGWGYEGRGKPGPYKFQPHSPQ